MRSDYHDDAKALPQEPGANVTQGPTGKMLNKAINQKSPGKSPPANLQRVVPRGTFRASVGHGVPGGGDPKAGAKSTRFSDALTSPGQMTGDPTIRYVNALTWAQRLPRTGKFSTADQKGKAPINYLEDLDSYMIEY